MIYHIGKLVFCREFKELGNEYVLLLWYFCNIVFTVFYICGIVQKNVHWKGHYCPLQSKKLCENTCDFLSDSERSDIFDQLWPRLKFGKCFICTWFELCILCLAHCQTFFIQTSPIKLVGLKFLEKKRKPPFGGFFIMFNNKFYINIHLMVDL